MRKNLGVELRLSAVLFSQGPEAIAWFESSAGQLVRTSVPYMCRRVNMIT